MTISVSNTQAANSRSTNILAGQQFEFLPARSMVSVRASSSATGLNVDFNVGGEAVIVDALSSDSNRFPIIPDDQLCVTSGTQGERLFLTLRNTTGAAITTRVVVEITPM